MDYDVILGRETIRSNNLVFHFPSQFVDKKSVGKMLVMAQSQTEKTPNFPKHDIERANDTKMNNLADPHHLLVLTAVENSSLSTIPLKDAYSREDISEIPDNKLEALPTELIYNSTSAEEVDEISQVKIFGSLELQQRIRELLYKYKTCFSSHVSDTPAQVSPFELSINEEEWMKPNNRLPPRRFDKTRQYEMRKQINLLVANNVIKPSTQPYYSQGFLVPKSDNKWRFVVDYKNLNKLTISENWPIPNIKEMIFRIGDQKPKRVGVMDLTSGYHQTPVSVKSRKYTAFITPWGVYEWLRLPMGVKGAPSYFQRIMGTEVLGGLIMVICELYLDDIIVFGSNDDEFIYRLECVLQRFQTRGITLNPSKCRLGLTEVTYVGHLINEHGIHFTRERLDSVINFPKPKTQKHLKSFLGLANWFRDHVNHHSTIVKPLNEMLKNYSKSRRLQWSTEAESAFETIKTAIHECPMLFFIDDTSPVYLETDASDYGIGAYLYQVIDGSQRPIGFLSQAFNERMMNWHTAHKEGYAIFYALQKWEYLLRDRHFILRTDHRNLTLLKDKFGHAQKVQRWLTCFQGFDYSLESLSGKTNTVADALSRLCTGDVPTEVAERLCLLEDIHVPAKFWTIISKVHNTLVGHHGIERTLQKLDAIHQDWTGRKEHVRYFIKMCPCCQKMSVLKGPIHAHPFTLSSYSPMSRLAIDYIEKLIPDEDGNTHILVIIDCFTRFVELFPLKENTARASAKALLCHLGRYGSCQQLVSDQGPSFINDIIEELTLMLGIDHMPTMAYSKEENGIVERANKEVLRHLRNIIFDKRIIKSWSIYLPLVQRIMNASVHHSTGVTPAQLLFGNAVNLDRGLLIEQVPGDKPDIKLSKYLADLLKTQATIIEIAQNNLQNKDSIHIETYNPERTEFPINSYVLVEHRANTLRKGPKSKLLPYLRGPMRVVNFVGNKYTLQNLVTNQNEDHHVTSLRPFLYDPVRHNPLQYAIRDDGDIYVVDKITDIRGNIRGKKDQIELEVHWVGGEGPTWEPWSNVRSTQALKEFLRAHVDKSVRNLLPKKERDEQKNLKDS